MSAQNEIEKIVLDEISKIQKKNKTASGSIKKTMRLFGGGSPLDSLDMAELIVRLEKRFGADPFRQSTGTKPVRTLGDLIGFYESHDASKKKSRK